MDRNPLPLDQFFDPDRIKKLWKNQPGWELQPTTQPLSPVMQTFSDFYKRIENELPDKMEGLKHFLDQIQTILLEQESETIPKSKYEENQKKLQSIFDDLEELLDALLMNR